MLWPSSAVAGILLPPPALAAGVATGGPAALAPGARRQVLPATAVLEAMPLPAPAGRVRFQARVPAPRRRPWAEPAVMSLAAPAAPAAPAAARTAKLLATSWR